MTEEWTYCDNVLPTCEGCGKPLPIERIRMRRCRDGCGRSSQRASKHAARTARRLTALPKFVGVDGEGETVNGEHRYVLLSVGDRSLHRGGEHLQFTDIMDFLLECYDPEATYVGYYLGYDFTMWMRTLPEDRAKMLFDPASRMRKRSGKNPTPFPVYYGDYAFDLMAGRRWKVRRGHGFSEANNATPWMYICDAGGFFQMPFVRASDPAVWPGHEIVTEEEREIIARGKARRASARLDEDMIAYNQAENRVLARMMTVMAQGFRESGVKLQKQCWFGPGQVAQAWMKKHCTHTREAVQNVTPAPILQAAQASFFGGWFEITKHGHVEGTTHEYDINSAYPHVHSRLPCFLHGNWRSGVGRALDTSDYVLVRATVAGNLDSNLGAMLHRTKGGRVLRPVFTGGWYWQHELEAAITANLITEVRYHEWHAYEPCTCSPPMAEGRAMYDMRLRVGKDTPQGKGLKLNYNSWYGKTAQSVGTPMFANPLHASLITAGCRTMILQAIASHPRGASSVVMVATDGVYFDEPHPTLPLSKKLGEWDHAEKQNLTLVMPGMYWDDAVRKTRSPAKMRSRGVNAAALVAMIDEFDQKFAHLRQWEDPWPKVEVHMPFAMVTAKQALQRGDWTLCGQVSTDYVKVINSDPKTKRDAPGIPRWMPMGPSTPYSRQFGMQLAENTDEHLGMDGRRIDACIAEVMNDPDF